jgi:phenylalanyl-tRNA synthetase beta chain
MKVSLNTIKQYIDFELPPVDELVRRINEQLGSVEEVIDLTVKYKDAKIVRVVECEKHPDADRLSVCKIDAGTGELVQVVCGAPNVHKDMWAVWLPPASTVPATYGTDEPFVLGSRELRGVMSNGMLAAADELGIGSDHAGIVGIDANEWKPNSTEIVPGASFARVYGLDDTIIDIENKMFTHRPDLFGQLGVAREIAGILGHTFASPEWYTGAPQFQGGQGLELTIENQAKEQAPRFMAVAMKNVTVKPSPLWLQCELVRLGGKPINNIVDVTNYIMLLTAQPTHAYDYDKLHGAHLGVRMARQGEKAPLLNGKTYELTENDIVIVDGEGPVGLAGIMGGANSEVSNDTKNIVLEVANFDMYTVRKSSMRHGLFTDALTRFNKGQSSLQQPHVLNLLKMMISDVAGGEQASDVFGQDNPATTPDILVGPAFISARLGLSLDAATIKSLLEHVEVPVSTGHDTLTIRPPFWRTDLELPEDIVEEVGRLYGFDKLPRELPQRSITAAPKNHARKTATKIRQRLVANGANEVLTYSFVHEQLMKKAGQDSSQAYRLSNALSPDLQYFRLSLVPSLLDKVYMNLRAGHDEFFLFEIGKAHHKDEHDAEGLPKEFGRIAGVYASKAKGRSAPYFAAARIVRQLIDDFNLTPNLQLQPLRDFDAKGHKPFAQLIAPFDSDRSGVVMVGNQLGGVIGELKPSVLNAFKLPEQTAAFELFPSLFETSPATDGYSPLSRFPSISQDISLRGDRATPYGDVFALVRQAMHDANSGSLHVVIEPVSIYTGDDQSMKTITFHVSFTSQDKTLTDADITPIMDAIVAEAANKLNLERI